jgi:hypothetical protein
MKKNEKIKKKLKKIKKINFSKNFDALILLKNKNLAFFKFFSKKFLAKQIFLSYFFERK